LQVRQFTTFQTSNIAKPEIIDAMGGLFQAKHINGSMIIKNLVRWPQRCHINSH